MDAFMRNRASDLGATLVNGLVTSIDTGDNNNGHINYHIQTSRMETKKESSKNLLLTC